MPQRRNKVTGDSNLLMDCHGLSDLQQEHQKQKHKKSISEHEFFFLNKRTTCPLISNKPAS